MNLITSQSMDTQTSYQAQSDIRYDDANARDEFRAMLQDIADERDSDFRDSEKAKDQVPLYEGMASSEVVEFTSPTPLMPKDIVLDDLSGNSAVDIAAVPVEGQLLPPIPDFDASGDELPSISNILMLDGTSLGQGAGLLQTLTDQINALQENSDASGVLFNLTPQQLTTLQKEIAVALESGEFPESLEGLNNFVSILPGKDGDALAEIEIFPFVQSATENEEALASLNDLLLDVQQRNFDDLLEIQSVEDKFSALLRNAASLNGSLAEDGAEFKSTQTKPAETDAPFLTPKVKGETAQGPQNTNTGNEAPANNGNATSPTGAIEGLDGPDSNALAALDLDGSSFSALALPQGGLSRTSALSGLQDLSHVTTQARHASVPHPGTSIVASSMRQSAGLEGNRTLTLQLDPPELGRVEVRMDFGPDKTLKTTVISEKPEAHLMLQRDAQALERAMQDSGIDTENSSLSFELADDGQGFEQDGRHDGSRNAARGGQGDSSEEIDVIETTMQWRVDPETGHMHYNILV